jgi:ribosome-binding factor A
MYPPIYSAQLYNIIGDRSNGAETQKGLESAAGFIRTTLARTLTIKRMPELSFAYDTSLDYAERIEKVIDDLKREQ